MSVSPVGQGIKRLTNPEHKLQACIRACELVFPREVIVILVVSDEYNSQSIQISSNADQQDTHELIRALAEGMTEEIKARARPN